MTTLKHINSRFFDAPELSSIDSTAEPETHGIATDSVDAQPKLSALTLRLIAQRRSIAKALGQRGEGMTAHARRGDIVKTYPLAAGTAGGARAMAGKRNAAFVLLDSRVADPEAPNDNYWIGWLATNLAECAAQHDIVFNSSNAQVLPECSVVHVWCRVGICLNSERDRVVCTMPPELLTAVVAVQNELIFATSTTPDQSFVGMLQRRSLPGVAAPILTGYPMLADGDPRQKAYELIGKLAREIVDIAAAEARQPVMALAYAPPTQQTLSTWLATLAQGMREIFPRLRPDNTLYALDDSIPAQFDVEGHGFVDVTISASTNEVRVDPHLVGDVSDFRLIFEDSATQQFLITPRRLAATLDIFFEPKLADVSAVKIRLIQLRPQMN